MPDVEVEIPHSKMPDRDEIEANGEITMVLSATLIQDEYRV